MALDPQGKENEVEPRRSTRKRQVIQGNEVNEKVPKVEQKPVKKTVKKIEGISNGTNKQDNEEEITDIKNEKQPKTNGRKRVIKKEEEAMEKQTKVKEKKEANGKTITKKRGAKKESAEVEIEANGDEDVKEQMTDEKVKPEVKVKKLTKRKNAETKEIADEEVKAEVKIKKLTKGKNAETKEISDKEVKPEVKAKKSTKGKNAEIKEILEKKPTKAKKKGGISSEPVPRPAKYESLGTGPAPLPSTGRKYMGCHVSGAGGVWKAFGDAEDCGASSFALFLRSQRQWAAKPLDQPTADKWRELAKDTPAHLILPHGSYLMNLGSPKEETRAKSQVLLLEELQRCEKLGIPHYNFHPGSSLGEISREECCKLIAEGINQALSQTKGVICVLENMSCQGNTVGGDLHELRCIIEHVHDRTRVGVCIDTCHAHAAGYDLGTEEGFNQLLDDFGKIIGWQFLRGLHVNDSKGHSGDHLDRHENIGRGTIGLEGFRRVMNCPHFNDIPLILETPYTDNKGYRQEIQLLQGLVEG